MAVFHCDNCGMQFMSNTEHDAHKRWCDARTERAPATAADDAGDRLAEIAARLKAAAGKGGEIWHITRSKEPSGITRFDIVDMTPGDPAASSVCQPYDEDSAQFITQAPADIAYLLELVTRQREQLAAVEAERDALEEGEWPFEWVVATQEREARKAAEDERDALSAQVAEQRAIIEHHLNSINVLNSENKALAAKLAAARAVVEGGEIMRDLFNASSHRSEDGINYTRWQEGGPDACYTMAGIMHALDALAALDGESDA